MTSLRGLVARYEETRDLRMIGAYQAGSDPLIDQAVNLVPLIYDAMQQTPTSPLSQDPYNDLAACAATKGAIMTKQQAPLATNRRAAEPSAVRPRDKRFDGYLKSAGFVLAVACFVLPFVMYLRHSRCAPEAPILGQKGSMIRSTGPIRRSYVRPMAGTRASPGKPSEELDPMTTATTADLKEDRTTSIEEASKQPFPGKPVFLLREIVGGLVMIEDDTGYWFVEKGATLPDGSKLVAIERGDGKDSLVDQDI